MCVKGTKTHDGVPISCEWRQVRFGMPVELGIEMQHLANTAAVRSRTTQIPFGQIKLEDEFQLRVLF